MTRQLPGLHRLLPYADDRGMKSARKRDFFAAESVPFDNLSLGANALFPASFTSVVPSGGVVVGMGDGD